MGNAPVQNEPLDVLCVADMCVDLVLSGDVRPRFGQVEQLIADYGIEIGGSANIFASQFAKLGGRAGVIGWVGRDVFGEFVISKLRNTGVDTSLVNFHPHLKTGIGVALVEREDRAILTYLGTINAVRPEQLPDNLTSTCRHWHVASYFLLQNLRFHWADWLKSCQDAGITTSLDTNWDPEERWQGVMEVLPFVDVFLPNEAEALAITGEANLAEAGRRLAACGPLVVIKRGGEGALVFQGKEQWQMSARPPAPSPVISDTIGAGDNFDAGFIRAWLLGRNLDECIDLAGRCAAASISRCGGIEGQLIERR